MTPKFAQSRASFIAARTAAYEAMVELQKALAFSASYHFTDATIGRHEAAMSKIQMHARKIVEAAIDAQVECGIAQGETDEQV